MLHLYYLYPPCKKPPAAADGIIISFEAFNPFSAACTAKTEQIRKDLIPCMICRPENPIGFIGKSCKKIAQNP